MFLFVYNFSNEKEHSISAYTLTNDEILKIKDGDIILRHGYGMVSDLIVKTMNEEFDISHCAVIVKDSNHFNVIHSVSQSLSDFDGVQIQSLSRFLKDSKKNSIIISRFKGKSNSLISEKARFYLGKKIKFDNDFNIKDSTKFYCTELIWKILKDVYTVDIFKNQMLEKDKKSQYKFNALWNKSNFEIIINHHLKK